MPLPLPQPQSLPRQPPRHNRQWCPSLDRLATAHGCASKALWHGQQTRAQAAAAQTLVREIRLEAEAEERREAEETVGELERGLIGLFGQDPLAIYRLGREHRD